MTDFKEIELADKKVFYRFLRRGSSSNLRIDVYQSLHVAPPVPTNVARVGRLFADNSFGRPAKSLSDCRPLDRETRRRRLYAFRTNSKKSHRNRGFPEWAKILLTIMSMQIAMK